MARVKPENAPSPTVTSRDVPNSAGQDLADLPLERGALGDRDGRIPWTPKCQLCNRFFLSEQTPAKAEEPTRKMHTQFIHFLSGAATTPRLRLQFDPPKLPLCLCHWLSFDLNVVEQRASEAGTAALDFPNDYFDRVLCTGLEAISRPIDLIAEIFRIVKPGGRVWLQTPPPKIFVAGKNETRPTYRWITPVGLRLLLQNFQELASSVQSDPDNTSQGTSFYFGTKNTSDSPTHGHRAPDVSTPRGKALLERLSYLVQGSSQSLKGNS